MGVLPLCHKVTYKLWTEVEGQGRFCPTPITMRCSTCSATGVLEIFLGNSNDENKYKTVNEYWTRISG